MLIDNNLIKGGDINNAIVIVDKVVTDDEMTPCQGFRSQQSGSENWGYLNNLELRFPNEPARHKLLDVVGDLAWSDTRSKAISSPTGRTTAAMLSLQKIKQYIKKNKH